MSSFFNSTLLLLSLGYFVDFFDLTVFAVVRESSLKDLGLIPGSDEYKQISALMFNSQALGVVIGGTLSGIWGDKIGRLSAVRIGILFYSVAMIGNAFATNIPFFCAMRLLAGIGLAGELAASVTLASELVQPKFRAYASGVIYSFGTLGGLTASYLGTVMKWQSLFLLGGCAGIVLLLLRLTLKESPLLENLKVHNSSIVRGSLKLLFSRWQRVKKLLLLIAVGVPFWFLAYCVNFAPEIAKQAKILTPVSQSVSLSLFLIGSYFGSFFFPWLSNKLSSNKKAIAIAMGIMIISIYSYKFLENQPVEMFYGICLSIGLASGYVSIFIMMAAEQFGTNLRATASSIVSNVIRGSLIPINYLMIWLNQQFDRIAFNLLIAGVFFFFLGILPLFFLKESSIKDLNYEES